MKRSIIILLFLIALFGCANPSNEIDDSDSDSDDSIDYELEQELIDLGGFVVAGYDELEIVDDVTEVIGYQFFDSSIYKGILYVESEDCFKYYLSSNWKIEERKLYVLSGGAWVYSDKEAFFEGIDNGTYIQVTVDGEKTP